MMECVGAKHRQETRISHSPLEMAFLDVIIRSFIKGINNFDMKKEAAKWLSSSARSFYWVYPIAAEARQTKIEVTKLADPEIKEK